MNKYQNLDIKYLAPGSILTNFTIDYLTTQPDTITPDEIAIALKNGPQRLLPVDIKSISVNQASMPQSNLHSNRISIN